MKKEFKKGTRFELKGIVYVVTEELNKQGWISYEYEDKRKPHYTETMAFMSMSTNWSEANIL